MDREDVKELIIKQRRDDSTHEGRKRDKDETEQNQIRIMKKLSKPITTTKANALSIQVETCNIGITHIQTDTHTHTADTYPVDQKI